MSVTLGSVAKITPPVLPKVSRRKRLMRLLDEGGKKPVVWVSGPAGSGKTTLVRSYLDARKLPCVWYRLDERDGDLATLFYYMGLATRKAAPQGKPLPPLTPENLADIPTFTRRFFEELFGRMTAPSLIVLDDYQDVPVASSFHETIVHGLHAIPKGITVVMMSRRGLPAAFSRLRANEKITFVSWKELRLTADETREIVALRGGRVNSIEAAGILHERTAGWAAGLVLLIESMRSGASLDRGIPGKPAPQEVFDYFTSEILHKLDIETQLFLLKTAFLPGIEPALAMRLTGNPDSAGILNDLNHNNIFTERHPHDNPAYHYHPLFRDFLQARARSIFPAAEIEDIRISAARLLAEQGNHLEDAANLFMETGEMEGLVGLILRGAQEMAEKGRVRTLEAWIDRTPADLRDAVPWLHFWKGICRQPISFTESRAHFERAFNAFERWGDKNGILLSLSHVVETFWLGGDNYALLDDWIGWLDERAKNDDRLFPSPDIELQVMANISGALAFARPDHPGIRDFLERGMQLAKRSPNVVARLKIHCAAIMHWAWLGDHARCAEIVSTLEILSAGEYVPPLPLIISKCVAAVANMVSCDHYEKSLQCVREGLAISRKCGVRVYDATFHLLGLSMTLGLGRMNEAREHLESVRETLDSDRTNDLARYHCMASWYCLLTNDLGRARTHADMSLDCCARSGGSTNDYAMSRLIAAVVHHRMGDPEGAENHFAPVREYARKTTGAYIRQVILLTEAGFAFDRGAESEGLEALRCAMALGREHGFFGTVYVWRRDLLARLCARALDAGIETEYVKQYIRKCRLKPDAATIHCEDWPRRVKVYTLGRFGILKNTETLEIPGKVQRPLSMLKAVIAFGGRNVPVEQIAEALWPEADGDAAHRSVATTLHRLRRLLGADDVLILRDGHIGLDPRHCWVDSWGFQRVGAEAVSLWKKGSGDDRAHPDVGRREEAVALSERAVGLYKGEFLAGDVRYSWALPMRVRLKGKFVRLIAQLGAYFERARLWDRAIDCYHRGLDADDLQEEFYRRLIICYRSVGRCAEAMATFDRCRDVLSSSFGIQPSRETAAAAKAIRGTTLA